VISLLEGILGTPVGLEELKHKPGRRRTLRAVGPQGSAIVKLYASERAPIVARRLRVLASGPPEPEIPAVLFVSAELRLVVLSEIRGRPLREALLDGDKAACARAGAALGEWHNAFSDSAPPPFRSHTIERELEILRSWAARSPSKIAEHALTSIASANQPWECSTVVHRDLYEEQVLLGDAVGLIDLDDAALGPPELDLGNLGAHVTLLSLRRGQDLSDAMGSLLGGYAATGPPIDLGVLARCRDLALRRLACIHGLAQLLEPGAYQPVEAPLHQVIRPLEPELGSGY
jgi:aminoglycoside phosphotransferase (APT) family kinase protein